MTLIGVHTPETPGEADIDRVREKTKENQLAYPVAVDNRAATWRAWGNRYWPSTYLIDKRGDVRYRWDGELNGQDARGEEIMRRRIEALIAEEP